MESGYDIKFEEMKKYIPFLESMIRRLENTALGAINPRQTQLSKIRSLRDLLLDRNKRMKMDNLLKCEQVLINLYSKVEQRDTLPGINKAPQNMSPPPPRVSPVKENLDKARRKLVEAAKSQGLDLQDTLPEIARANQTEVACSGSKEPALFQRRPNNSSRSTSTLATERSHLSNSKRNYTRVLVSPEPPPERRLRSPENSLYQRRSPKSLQRSGSYHKKERKKEIKRSGSKGSRSDGNLNITLQVPGESLSSLDTEDIFDRIIDCDNADVDIGTLRDLRTQILGELKETGVKEDISDLILKSYRNKKKRSGKKKQEVEEGELSDSESEAIQSIYGSLVIVDGEKGTGKEKKPVTSEKGTDADSRKIQIRLVISNTDKDEKSEITFENKLGETKSEKNTSVTETVEKCIGVHLEEVIPGLQSSSLTTTSRNQNLSPELKKLSTPVMQISSPVKSIEDKTIEMLELHSKEPTESNIQPKVHFENAKKEEVTQVQKKENKANFYNPIAESDVQSNQEKTVNKVSTSNYPEPVLSGSNKLKEGIPLDQEEYLKLTCDSSDEFKDEDVEVPKESPKIPFLSEPTLEPKPPKEPENLVSQIDILQALKNEILGDSLILPGTEVVTPALHQPKVTKVSNVKEISVKKTISLEKYKQQSQMPKSFNQQSKLFSSKIAEDISQKPSRGLTAKECERFNFSNLVLDDLSDEEDGQLTKADVEDIYADLAPQSPDAETIIEDLGNESPVIIPADPVKPSAIVSNKNDVDMRAKPPMPLPQNIIFSPNSSIVSVGPNHEQNKRPSESLNRPSDPRKRKETFNPALIRDHSNSPVFHPSGTPRQNFPNVTPSMTPSARSFEMTPSHPNFEEDQQSRKHVYAPTVWDERDQSVSRERSNDARAGYNMGDGRSPRWEEQNTRSNSVIRDEITDHRSNRDRYQPRPRVDPRLTDRRDDGYSRADCPPTPSHYFGRGDYPATPSHPFGRSECPMTPSHPFGNDCPPTPSHSFGMSEVPRTPSHPFGRSEYPGTPSHPFGRSECPTTPIHPFGRSNAHPQDPRFNRNYEEDDHHQSRDKYRQHSGGNEPYKCRRGQEGRNENRSYAGDYAGGGRQISNLDQRYEHSDGRSRAPSLGRMGRDYEGDRSHEEDCNSRRQSIYDIHYDDRSSVSQVGTRRPRERSVGRMPEQQIHTRSNPRAPSVGRTFCPTAAKTVSVESQAGRSFTIDTSVKATFQEFNFNDLSLKRSFDARRQRAASVGRSLNRDSSAGRNFNREGSVGPPLIREGSIGRSSLREGSVGRTLTKSNDAKFHTNRNYAFKRAQSVGRDLSSHVKYSDHQARFESFKAMAMTQSIKPREKSVDRNREPKTVFQRETPKPQISLNPRDPRSRNAGMHVSQKNKKDTFSPRPIERTMKYKDPRMRKNSKLQNNRYHDQGHDSRRFDSHERKKYGIVYTNDNIAKGNVLGPGYGVKNYKIPKIKRPIEEVPPQKVEQTEKTNGKSKESDKKKDIAPKETASRKEQLKSESNPITASTTQPKEINTKTEHKSMKDSTSKDQENNTKKEPEKIERHCVVVLTKKEIDKPELKSFKDSSPQPQRKHRRRQRFKEPTPPKEAKVTSPIRTRRTKRPVIYDSESDNNTDNTSDVSDLKTKDRKAPPQTSSPAKGSELDDLQFSFDMQDDDLDIFSENIASDTVTGNISDLIADLDKDIGTTQDDSLIMKIAEDNTFDNILESLTSADSTNLLSENNEDSQSCDTANLGTVVTSIQENADPLRIEQKEVTQSTESTESLSNDVDKLSNEIESQEKTTDVIEKEKSLPSSPLKVVKEKESNDVVSTSISEEQMSEKIQSLVEQNERHSEACSTPDSTINTEDNSEHVKPTSEKMPDSTNVALSEMNSDISSTHDHLEKSTEAVAESNSSKMGSLGLSGFLSLLQDKTKINELLSMLNDQPDHDKIKKKLEKLVSDEEESIQDKTAEEMEVKTPTETDDADNTLLEEVKEQLTNDTAVSKRETKEPETENKTLLVANSIVSEEIQTPSEEKTIISEASGLEKIEDQKGEEISDINEKTDDNSKSGDTSKEENVPTDNVFDNVPKVIKTKKAKKRGKAGKFKKSVTNIKKRLTRSSVSAQKPAPAKEKKPKPQTGKKKSTELQKLQDDIRDMFISNEVLNATGIRNCRLAKLVEQKRKMSSEDSSPTKSNESSARSDADERSVTPSPVVVLEKINKVVEPAAKPARKKPGPKPKVLNFAKETEKVEPPKSAPNFRPGPKSKTKHLAMKDIDPYDFDDSISETTKASENNSSDSDDESLASSHSLNSSDLQIELKSKHKRKRCSWNKGVIKARKGKKNDKPKEPAHLTEQLSSSASESHISEPAPALPIEIPDWNCFIDKSYCFSKSNKAYKCRLCGVECENIVHHYKKQHPHYEIPLSRMNPLTAMEAIKQSMITNFQQISKVPVLKYVCRFCFTVFDDRRKKNVLEGFFWHVVSKHTGEYKQLCAECTTVKKCTFMLDIPPPPPDKNGLLMGYICGKCNYTQVSLENLKNHVSLRHNDEETEVYTISLGAITQKMVDSLKLQIAEDAPRALRSLRSKPTVNYDDNKDQGTIEPEEPPPPRPMSVQSKISFEGETESGIGYLVKCNSLIKSENEDEDEVEDESTHLEDQLSDHPDEPAVLPGETVPVPEFPPETVVEPPAEKAPPEEPTSDVFLQPHFKVNFTETGNKEYLCCINGDEHYKTTLLISMKKHVQIKHTKQRWDGYCSVCKVIVMPQGVHDFKQLLGHLLDTHMGNFPEVEKTPEETLPPAAEPEKEVAAETPRAYINVRPITQLISQLPPTAETEEDNPIPLPKIQSVISLNTEVAPAPPTELATEIENYQEQASPPKEIVEYKYEEVVKEIMRNKHQIVLDSMMSDQKLAHIFKCAGRYCSFTCNEAESAVIHASTHSRIGGTDAFRCCYCSFDSSGNAIDLVSHVFKEHGCCKFICRDCFYRAYTGPLVEAHFARVHGPCVPGAVLQACEPAAATGAEVKGLLSRQEAVRYYSCCFGKEDGGCKFKTYTPGKFCEHLLQKHSDAKTYPCDECVFSGATATLLVQHLQTHGLQLYQCPWCVHGTDSEAEMLGHASLRHPTKRPQAYLRHKVETKAGQPGPKFKVLPFVHITKKTVLLPVAVPDSVKPDNPSREAARSLELEKLIGHTSKIIEEATVEPPRDEDQPESILETSPPGVYSETPADTVYPEIPADAMILPFDTVDQSFTTPTQTTPQSEEPVVITIIAPPRQVTPPPVQSQVPIAEQSTPKLKTEPLDEAKNHSTEVIYCLDSDDDEAQVPLKGPAVVDLSEENNSNFLPAKAPASTSGSSDNFLRLPLVHLYKCHRCKTLFKTGHTLKRHYFECYPDPREILQCAHCSFASENKNDILNHYSKQHSPVNKYICGICNDYERDSKETVRRHAFDAHAMAKVSFHAEKRGEYKESVHVALPAEETEPKPRGRRKRSVGEPAPAAPAKLKRYGLDTLPINQIFDEPVQCSLCDFSNKVRQNMIRHFQLHSQQRNVPQNAPVNPVPHLETNEMHFDKMHNLASSSVVTRETSDAAIRYPGFVPERERYACGAKGCSYISINEAMLRCHWETLHAGSNDYHCVHCPPIQQLDTSRPLTAGRIIMHLKMHDVKLFGCTACAFYHNQLHLVEKHVAEKHSGNARPKAIRGPAAAQLVTPPPPSASAPTMDLKPWQCGLCKFKSMLRPEVVDHCAKTHQSKFQFKCAFCPWRSSAMENVTKHHANTHAGQQGDVFYFYYREGSIPDTEGTPRWMKQRQKTNPQDPEVKVEQDPPPASKEPPVPQVDLNLVKKEMEEPESTEALCKKFGAFCEPNGLKYKCSLCKQATEDSKEAMQSHLYEELKYRKWGCSVCTYKAFHQKGLKDHAFIEHRQNLDPLELPSDREVEAWVAQLLKHQEVIIQASLANLQKQKPIAPEKDKDVNNTSKPSTSQSAAIASKANDAGLNDENLEQALGKFGAPSEGLFACPKCEYKAKEESQMSMHLISELDKLRWRCSVCQEYFQIYHEAQLHCKSVHPGQAARTVPTTRDPVIRNAWVNSVIQTQRDALSSTHKVPDVVLIDTPEKEPAHEPDNSLLVVRYAETVPTPEEALAKRSEETLAKRKEVKRKERKRPVYSAGEDSDDERLVIDEPQAPQAAGEHCPYCEFTTPFKNSIQSHILRHYNLKPFKCARCDYTGHNQSVSMHQHRIHPGEKLTPVRVEIPKGNPTIMDLDLRIGRRKNISHYKCLLCDKIIQEEHVDIHVHPNREPQIAQTGDNVLKCGHCVAMRKTLADIREHHNANHPNMEMNYGVVKLEGVTKFICRGSRCHRQFAGLQTLKLHHSVKHPNASLNFTTLAPFADSYEPPTVLSDDDDVSVVSTKRTYAAAFKTAPKRIARKSTTKLPFSHPVARKSTSKLPFLTWPSDTSESELDEEYSYYGTKPPSLNNFSNVTTLMPFLNTVMPFTLEKLREFVNINPKVMVKDVANP